MLRTRPARRFARNCLTVVLAVAAMTAPAGPAAAIAHGDRAADGAYRFSVRLTMTGLPEAGGGTRDSWCSGALIAPRWVITAGHCFRDAGGRRVSRTVARRTDVTVGRTRVRTTGGYATTVIAVHQSDSADVALAELDTAVTGVEPLRIAGRPPATGEVVRLTGYGLTGADGSAPADRLHTGQFTVGRVEGSTVELSGVEPRPDTSPCRHDSGGPYFRELPGSSAELVAVVSTGPGCPHPGPDIGARADNLAGWIAGTTGPDDGRSRWLVAAGLGAAVLVATFVAARFRNRRRNL